MLPFAPITLGQAVRSAESPSFVATETRHSPRTRLPPHAHENAAMSYVIEGDRSYRFGSRAFDCIPGSITCFPPASVHSSRFSDEEAHGLMVEVRSAGAAPAGLFAEPRTSSRPDIARIVYSIRREIAAPDEVRFLALESLGFELLVREVRYGRQAGGPAAWLLRAREAVHDGFRTPPSLAALAADAGVHRGQVAREFRRHFGMAVGEYVRCRRVSRAWELVIGSDLSLAEIAAECGFADQSHLTRSFRRAYGRTPGRQRREGGRSAGRSTSAAPVQDSSR
jgi:AraC family transcriptional regulator